MLSPSSHFLAARPAPTRTGTEQPNMSDSPDQSSLRDEHETMNPPVPTGQRSPVVLITAPVMQQTLEPGTQPPNEGASPGSQDPTQSQTSSPTLAFPIMKLPPEIRLMVFDQLFLDLTVRRQHNMKYHNEEKLLQKHQVNDFRPYTNLLLTCKELNKEARKLWEEQYLHECCFYFWHVSKLYDLAVILEKLGRPYTEIKYVLRTRFAENFVCNMCPAATAAEAGRNEAVWFIQTQPGVPPSFPKDLEKHFFNRLFPSTGDDSGKIEVAEGTYEATDENPVRTVVHKEAGTTFALGKSPDAESCTISTHLNETVLESTNHDANNEFKVYEGRGARADTYEQMQGKFSGIFWGGYDAAVGYGKLELWEALPLFHLESHCQCKKWNEPSNRHAETKLLRRCENEHAKLLDKWFKKITKDRKWLALGGAVDDEGGMTRMLEEYNLSPWLEEEFWDVRANENWESMCMSDSAWEEVEDFRRLTAREDMLERQYEEIMRERGLPIEY
jgi:hypothetical protein